MFPFDTNREPPQSSIFCSSFIINNNLQKWDDFLHFQPHLWDDFSKFKHQKEARDMNLRPLEGISGNL